jgi:transcriptional regulator with XRE-family HTH domain
VENPPLGHQLRALRTAAGRTVASVAADAGLSVPYIANLENGRGNPTTAALGRLATALGGRLVITLTPPAAGPPATASPPPEVPASLVRFARTPRFRHATATMATARQLDPRELARHLIPAMAALASALSTDLSDPDWGRILDALLLTAAHPHTSQQTRS